jgi:circadian clock protein KaiC
MRRDERSVVALFEKTPSQMLNNKLDQLVQSGHVALLNLRTLDLSVDETLHALESVIDETGATRVVIDSLSGFALALAPEFREDFRESLYRMTTVLSEKGVTLLMTYDLEASPHPLPASPVSSAFLVDAIVMQRFVEADAELHSVISVIKVRGSSHSRQLRKFRITADGMDIDAGPAPFKNMLRLGDGSSR